MNMRPPNPGPIAQYPGGLGQPPAQAGGALQQRNAVPKSQGQPASSISGGNDMSSLRQPLQDVATIEQKQEEKVLKDWYQNISVANTSFAQVMNDLSHFPQHLKRSGEQDGLLCDVASPDEKKFIKAELGELPTVVVNMLVWRRSLMKIVLISMAVAVTAHFLTTWADAQHAYENYQEPLMNPSYSIWQEKRKAEDKSVGFDAYTFDVLYEIEHRMLLKARVVEVMGTAISCALSVFSMGAVWMANMSWVRFKFSRQVLMAAWFFTIAAPFLVSIVPARLWVSWSECKDLMDTYRDELEGYLNLAARIDQMQETCTKVKGDFGEDKIQQGVDLLEKICGTVDKFPKNRVKVPKSVNVFNSWAVLDFAEAHKACADGRAWVGEGNPQNALAQARAGCEELQTTLEQTRIVDADGTASHAFRNEIADYFAGKLRYIAEASVAMYLALRNFATLFPAAMSIAPGLLKGALRMKLFIPQSNIPGMFVLILPWLYCPLTWCMYSVFFQLIGNVTLLLGMLVVAFTPLTYFVVGVIYNINHPLSDAEVTTAIHVLNKAMIGMMALGYGLVLLFLHHVVRNYAQRHNYWGYLEDWGGGEAMDDWGSQQESQLLEGMFDFSDWDNVVSAGSFQIVLIVCNILKAYMLTVAAGVDLMIGQMVSFRQVEIEIHEQKAASGETNIIKHEYEERMDALLHLDRGEDMRNASSQ